MLRIFRYCFLLLILSAGAAHAITVPGPADAGRLEKNIKAHKDIQIKKPESEVIIKSSEPVQDKTLPSFELKTVMFSGVNAYTADKLKPLYENYLNTKINKTHIQKIADDLTQKYYSDGYVLVIITVPKQDFKNGVAQIKVVEGYVGDVKLEGKFQQSRIITGVADKIAEMRPLNAKKLEENMLTLEQLSGLKASAIIQPKQNAKPGEVSLLLKLEEKKLKDSISIDNFGSRYVGAVEGSATKNFNSVFQPYDHVAITGFAALPMEELTFFSILADEPIDDDGSKLSISASISNSAPGYTLKQQDIKSISKSVEIKYTKPLINRRAESLDITAQLGHKDVKSKQLGTELYHDQYTAARLGTSYEKSDSYQGVTNLELTLSQGLDFIDTRETGSNNLSRAKGHSDFTKLELSASRLQQIDNEYQALASISGQYSYDPLLSSEEFGYGGQQFGRVYDSSEITGDDGIAAALELRYGGLPAVYDINSQLFAFYDVGKVWNIDPGAKNQTSAASAGTGLRFSVDNLGLSGSLMGAIPLTKQLDIPDYGSGSDPQFFFSLRQEF